MNLVSVQLGATCPHLALVLGSQRVDELLHAERFPHQHCDPLWRDPQRPTAAADRKSGGRQEVSRVTGSYLADSGDVGLHVWQNVTQT